MVKSSGLGDRLFVNGLDLSGDVGSLSQVGYSVGEMNVTGISKTAVERIQLQADGQLQFNNFFSDATNSPQTEAHADLNTGKIVTYFRGTTTGNHAAGMDAKIFQASYNRGQNGSLLGTVTAKVVNGAPLEWGEIIDFAGFSDTDSGETGSAYDLGASHGLTKMAFYLHVYDFDGTTATILIEDDDNSGFTSATTYGTFAAVTAVGAQRLAVAAAPERYLRWSVSGTYTDLTFAIVGVRNPD